MKKKASRDKVVFIQGSTLVLVLAVVGAAVVTAGQAAEEPLELEVERALVAPAVAEHEVALQVEVV